MENKVYVFLDIDGVLNAPGDKIIFEMFEEKKLELLIDFIKEMKASLVITSSRRTYPSDLKIINNIFSPVCEVGVLSEKRLFKYRGEEIDLFIKQNKIKKYVIFDDNDGGISRIEELKKHFILIDYLTGLTLSDIKNAKMILQV